MARLSRVAIAVAALCGCSAALADPVSLILGVIGITGTAATVISIAATIGFGLITSNQAKRKQAAAAAAQRSSYNASLQDRNVTGLSAEAPWKIVYGQPAPVGGSLVALLGGAPRPIDYTGLNPTLVNFVNSFARPEIKHLVVVFAAHECQNIFEVFLDGEPIGTNALTANGDNTIGAFASTYFETITETLTFVAPGIATPSATPAAVSTAVRTVVPPYDPGQGYDGNFQAPPYELTAQQVDIVGANLQIPSGSLTPIVWTVTYQVARTQGFVNVQKHLGAGTDVADPYLRQATDAWTVNDKLTGYCYAVITLSQGLDRFKGGPPNISARIVGKKVFDFRTGQTVYSRNPALCLADFIQSEAGYGATLQQFDVPSIIAAANACDAQGFFCDGAFSTEQDRESTKQELEDSFGGTCHQSGGVWRITPGAWTPPVMTLTDADCAAPIQITQASYTSKERFNTVRGKYVPMDSLGVATDFTPLANAAHLAVDGFVKVKDIALPFTGEHQRAQDLARMLIERSRGGLTITYPGHMRLWPLLPGDRVVINNAEFGWAAKPFRVTDWVFHPRSSVALTMIEDVAAYYDAANIITVDASPNTNLPSPFLTQDLFGLTASSGTAQLLLQSDGTVVTRVLWAWTAATQSYVLTGGKVERQWKAAGDDRFVWEALPDEQGSETSAYQDNAPDGISIICRARFVNQRGIPGQWNVIAHFVVGKTQPPNDIVGLRYEFEGFGIRANWAQVADVDLSFYEIRIGGTSWATSTVVFRAKTTTYFLAAQLAGTKKLWVKAVDLSGNYSENAASIDMLVLAPKAVVFKDVRVEQNKVNFEWLGAKTSQPILSYQYRVAKVVGGVAGAYIGRGSSGSDSRSDNIPFFEAATWRIEITATDVAGNVGTANTTDVLISLPDDYTPLLNTTLVGGGAMVNSVKTGLFGRVTLLLNATETWQSHFTSRGWNTIQDQINAGFPLYFQPGTTTASYTEGIDAGVVFTAGTIAVNLSINTLAGAPVSSIQIGYKRLIGDEYTFAAAGARNVIAQNFRYIRIIVSANGTGADLAEIELLQTSIDVQQISENTTVVCLSTDANGTLYSTTRGFTDVQGVIPGAIVQGSAIARVEARIVDAGAPGTPAQVFIYLFNAASQRVSGNQYITINGV